MADYAPIIYLLAWTGLLTAAGIRLVKRGKFHLFYLLCAGLFVLIGVTVIFSGYLFGSSFWRENENTALEQLLSFLSFGEMLLLLALPVLSIVSFFLRNKPWYIIALSVFMLLLCALFAFGIYLLAGMGKIGG